MLKRFWLTLVMGAMSGAMTLISIKGFTIMNFTGGAISGFSITLCVCLIIRVNHEITESERK
jgi:hypothetical protein